MATHSPAVHLGLATASLSIVLVTAGGVPVGAGGPDPAAPAHPLATARFPTGVMPTAVTSTSAPTTDPAPVPDTLGLGDSGPAVLALQERLTALGYWLGTPDGSYGLLTQQAAIALQGTAGIARDGVVGPNTHAALDAGIRPTARSTTGAVTEIDRDTGVIIFARDGDVQLVLHTSTGTFETYYHEGRQLLADTPEGQFTVTWAHDGWRDGALGQLYRPRYFHPDGIAVHGYPSVPAYPASHGCARVTNAAIDMVWASDLMPIGSEVWVY